MTTDLRDGFRLGDFDVLPMDGRLVGQDNEVRVQPKVIDVLLCLAEEDGGVVSRQLIHEKVWGDVIVTDDALNRCISELRRAFGDKRGKDGYIQTVPKRGYRLTSNPKPLAGKQAITTEAATAQAGPPSLATATATVAVLPFQNLSPESPNAYLGDALAVALHSALARMNRIRVSSRRSSFALRDSTAPASEIGETLGAQYIVSGTIAEAGDRIRITAEVDDAEAGLLLWSHRYDLAGTDLLETEQQLAEAVVGAFGGQRLRAEISKAHAGASANQDAWGLVQRARAYLVRYRASALKEALEFIQEAVGKEPDYALAQATLGLLLAENLVNGLSAEPARDIDRASAAVSSALELAPTDPAVLRSCGCAQAYYGDNHQALKSLRSAVKSAPFDFGAWGYLGWPLTATGDQTDLDQCLAIMDRLLENAPSHPGAPFWQYHRSVALACAEKPEQALAPMEECLEAQPEFGLGLMHYANLLGSLDRVEEAKAAATRASSANSAMTVDHYAGVVHRLTDDEKVRELRLGGLKRSGLLT